MIHSRKTFSFAVALLAIFTLSTGVFAGGYNLAGTGPRALAMSGAFHAIADDWSAGYWNPAGLAGQGNELSLGFKILYPTVTLTPNAVELFPGYSGYNNDVEKTTEEKGFPAGDLGVTYRVNDKFTAGFGIFAPAALGTDWRNLFVGFPTGYGNTATFPEKAWNGSITVIDFHPSVAYAVNDQLSFGFGIAIQHGTIELETLKIYPTGVAIPPFTRSYVDVRLEGDGLGFGFNFGTLYKFNDFMNVGLSYRSPVNIPVEGTVKQQMFMPNEQPMQALVAEPDAKADFPIPGDIGLGIAIKAMPNLTIAFDVLLTQWSYVDEITIELDGIGLDGNPATDSEMIMHYEDTYKFSVGADYLLCPKHNVHLLGGYYFDPTPIPGESLRPTIADVADKHNISLGASYSPMHNFTIQGYWEYIWTPVRTVDQVIPNPALPIEDVAGDWKLNVTTFGLSFGYKF